MPWIAADAHLVLGMIALAKGEWSQVDEWLGGAGLAAPEDGSVPLVAGASGARIRLALARQDVDLAAAEADGAWTRLRDKGVWVCAAEAAPRAVKAALAAGRPEVAADRAAEFAAGLHGRRAPVADAALDWCHALIAEAAGQSEPCGTRPGPPPRAHRPEERRPPGRTSYGEQFLGIRAQDAVLPCRCVRRGSAGCWRCGGRRCPGRTWP
ncbi:hypothetical protein [Streptomyces sp. R44]|uniref:Uncharacterized protein n=1 Tax=Streptomyces sp. R44 TaxID=3238633 RepID=A0AB39TAJ5_9ACTN